MARSNQPRDPSGIVMGNARVLIRSLAPEVEDDGSFFIVQERDVSFLGQDDLRELSEFSRISQAGQGSTLPMAQDNARFFYEDGIYGGLLDGAVARMKEISETDKVRKLWREPSTEVGLLGWLWRFFVRIFILLTNDEANRLRYTRGIQDSLPYQSAYESVLLERVIHAFDRDGRQYDSFNLPLAFKNRNASRILVQNMSRYDRVWHLSTQVTWNRIFDLFGQLPLIGVTSFAASENFPSSKNHALRAMLRGMWEGSWFTRTITRSTQGLVTLDNSTAAQNLAAESNGFEEANRNQLGTFFGRIATNSFRIEHGLPTDESVVRTFMTTPASTMVNNGIEHVLRCLAKHWKNMLFRENGNFAHQRMEQLNPFEILRFHMPVVLVTLSNLRGRNKWDSTKLGPFIKRLQNFNPSKAQRQNRQDVEDGGGKGDVSEVQGLCKMAQRLVHELKKNIVPFVCAGVPSRVQPFQEWLDSISESCNVIAVEAQAVKELVASVSSGIKLGYVLLKLVNWKVPADSRMRQAILNHIRAGSTAIFPDVPSNCIQNALQKLEPKDERTLRELVTKQGLVGTDVKLLLGRTKTLLVRELRRRALDKRIRECSRGQAINFSGLVKNRWYWVNHGDGWGVHLFAGKRGSRLRFTDVVTNNSSMYETKSTMFLQYIPIAEAISRAQRVFMTLELDHGKKFSYNAFMEFGSTASSSSLRTLLRRLAVVSQIQCYELDTARLNVLTEMKIHVRNRLAVPGQATQQCGPQSVLVHGSGPAGLMLAIHCVQSVIMSGGEVKLYEDRDAYEKKAAAFERAQIVRLDARQISMLRYHLGTSFEDVFIPATGETNPHIGNVLSSQGFVEVTIKRLEFMLLNGIVELYSKDLLHYYADSKVHYEVSTGSLSKKGRTLKPGDSIHLAGDVRAWKVQDFGYEASIAVADLVQGHSYDIVLPRDNKVCHYRLDKIDRESDWYEFVAQEPGRRNLVGGLITNRLPPIYPRGQGRIEPSSILLECNTGPRHTAKTKELPFDEVAAQDFQIDVSNCHVILAIGKSHELHFNVTTSEPYAVCCMEGMKISRGMHNFGQPRWGAGIVDDIRSHGDQNTRIIGDFTKSVVLLPIVKKMKTKLVDDPSWRDHFERLAEKFDLRLPTLLLQLVGEVDELVGRQFRRTRLQTRFFELGNNWYLGMELPREFDVWRKETSAKLLPAMPETAPQEQKTRRDHFQKALDNSINRLWFESTTDIISEGDVYNAGGRSKIPKLYTIDSPFEQKLSKLERDEAFSLAKKQCRVVSSDGFMFNVQYKNERVQFAIPKETYVIELQTGKKKMLAELSAGDHFEPVDMFEVLVKGKGHSTVRNSGGFVAKMKSDVPVFRLSNLSRDPDGYSESKVALASFPVAHSVCHRTLQVRQPQRQQLLRLSEGYITAFVGDAQASPHFMRYSGLTGACINCMSFNNFVDQALRGVEFQDRAQRYAFETNWSNGEVVERGTGANYGGSFLRPGFLYGDLIDYLYAQALEHREIGAEHEELLTRDWKIKIAAALVPRGLETDKLFLEALHSQLTEAVHIKFEKEVLKATGSEALPEATSDAISEHMAILEIQLRIAGEPIHVFGDSSDTFSTIDSSVVQKTSAIIKVVGEALKQTVDYAIWLRVRNQRISSEMFSQSKPVDSLVDDFPVEAQAFANSLTQSTAFGTGAIALRLIENMEFANVTSFVFGVLSIAISFGTMTNVSRYKNRNEEFRLLFAKEKMSRVMKGVFSRLSRNQRDAFHIRDNPFVSEVEQRIEFFAERARYYGYGEDSLQSVRDAFDHLKRSCNDTGRVLHFMKLVVGEFIPVTFHKNSYLKEDLVNIYRALYEMLDLLQQANTGTVPRAEELYRELVDFRLQLDQSIQRGEIRYGFLKDRPWSQQAFIVTVRYLVSALFPKYFGTIGTKTGKILRETKSMLSNVRRGIWRREVQDLEELYFATKESEIGSMIFFSVSLGFVANSLFTIFRLVSFAADPGTFTGESSEVPWISNLLNAVSWAAIISLLGALLALFHFVRKLKHLARLDRILGQKKMTTRHIRGVTRTQELLTVIRIVSNAGGCVALPWSVVAQMWGSQFNISSDVPVYIALGAVLAVLAATILSILVEFVIQYNVDPCLGMSVCEPFREELEKIYLSYRKSAGVGEFETEEKLQADAWDYTAREFLHTHRFDTVFAADRFGSILQYIQHHPTNVVPKSGTRTYVRPPPPDVVTPVPVRPGKRL